MQPNGPLRATLPVILGTLLGVLATISIFVLPQPVPAAQEPTSFSAERAMGTLERLADEPHSIADRAAHARARDDVVAALTDLGYRPTVRSDPMPDTTRGGDPLPPEARGLPLESIVVDVPGRSPDTLLLMSHYDSAIDSTVWPQELRPGDSHGAGDAGYGVATIIETLRAVEADGRPLQQSLRIVITDAEEPGLLGASSELERHLDEYADVRRVVNVEARGMSGPALMFETSPGNEELVRRYLEAAPTAVTSSLFPGLYRVMPNATDFTPFLEHGFTGVNLAAVGGGDHYHDASDSLANTSPATLQHYGDQVLGVTRAWVFDPAGSEPAPAGPDAGQESPFFQELHFFTVWRGFTVRYPEAVGLGIGVAAVLAAAAVVVRRRRDLRWRSVAGTVWGVSWRPLVVAVPAGLLQVGLSWIGLAPAPSAPFGPNPLLPWLFLTTAATIALWVGSFLLRRARAGADVHVALLLLLAAVTVSSLVGLPGGSYLVSISTLVFAGCGLVPRAAPVATVVTAVAAAVVAALFGPIVVLVHQAMSATSVAVSGWFAAVPVTLLVALCLRHRSTGPAGPAVPEPAEPAPAALSR